jgi:ubiquinone/menaquinone biosynthesis C-methylase UbiE
MSAPAPPPQPNPAPTNVWSAVAKAYVRNIAPGFKPAVERLCRYAGIKKGDRVLDIGCGPGTASFAAVHQGADVTGVDASAEMIAMAKEITGTRREYTFLEGDMHSLPVPDGGFEAVISSFGVVLATNPPKAVAEMARVLVPGGRMAILVWPRAGVLARYYDLLDKHLPYPRDTGRVDQHRWADLNIVRGWLADQFDAVASAEVEVPLIAKTQAAAWDMLKTSTARVAPLYEQLSPEAKAVLDKEMLELFRGYKKPDGTVSWPRKALMIRATKHVEVVPQSNTLFRSIIAVLGGYMASALVASIATGIAGKAMLPSVTAAPTESYLIASLVLGLLASVLGGWLTAKLAPNEGWKHLGGLAGLALVVSVLTNIKVPMLPLWFKVASAAAVLAGVGIGGLVKVGLPKKEP